MPALCGHNFMIMKKLAILLIVFAFFFLVKRVDPIQNLKQPVVMEFSMVMKSVLTAEALVMPAKNRVEKLPLMTE